MKELIKNVIEEYMESEDMKKYLIENIDILQKWQIIELIGGARADLSKKYKTLKVLAENCPDEDKEDWYYTYANAAKVAKEALDELTLKDGEVFLMMEYGFDEDTMDEKLYGAEPAFSLRSVLNYGNEDYEEYEEAYDDVEQDDLTYWYRLEKYVPDGEDLKETICYTIAPNGEIWFVRWYGKQWREKEYDFFRNSRHLNLPIPFEVGDIITIDSRPFALPRHAVIIEKGDNWGCCVVQIAWIGDDGKVYSGALKHTRGFNDDNYIEVSSLYRAELFKDELPEKERFLGEIADYVRGDEEKGFALSEITEGCQGTSVEQVREYMETGQG